MDLMEENLNINNKRRNKMLIIDSGDDDEVAKEPLQIKNSTYFQLLNPSQSEKKQTALPMKHHQLDSKKLKYLFEPDLSKSEKEADESEDGEGFVEKPQIKKKPKIDLPKRINVPVVQSKVRDSVQIDSLEDLRIEILKRWWYCLGDWPPVEYDYTQQLRQHKLRKIEYQIFKKEPEVDDKDNRKVYAVEGFPGIFKSSAGDTFDLRPQDTCPSFDNIRKINPKHLPKLFIKGLKAQLQDILNNEPFNEPLLKEIRFQISKSERKFQQYLE